MKICFLFEDPGCISNAHNHGSENEEGDAVYNTGNGDSTGTKDGQSVGEVLAISA